MRIPEDFIRELLSRADILEVVGRYVSLKKKGRLFFGLCPFHQEKTPSFMVDATRGSYHCFGCGAHGDALGFLKNHAFGGDFRAALENLANQCGMTIPKSGGESPQLPAVDSHLQKALSHYRRTLADSPHACDYLKSRGIDGASAKKFRLGYAPDSWNFLKEIFSDYDGDLPVRAGLVRAKDGGKRYDYFRDRILFPIFGESGKLQGFGGRALGDAEPKYLNSPQSPAFDKGRALFGIDSALPSVRAAKRVFAVEGYMDAIALSQFGIGEVVATMGTAATAAQLGKLLRLADNVFFAFDGDEAGRRAARRALENIAPQLRDGKSVAFIFPPMGEDPDSFIRKNGKDAFEKLAADALSFGDFLVESLIAESDSATDEGRASAFLSRAVALANRINSEKAPFLRRLIYQKIAKASGVAERELQRVGRRERAGDSRPRGPAAKFQMRDTPLFRLLCSVAQMPSLAIRLENAPLIGDRKEAWVVELIRRKLADGGESSVAELLREAGLAAVAAQVESHLKSRGDAETEFAAEEDFTHAAEILSAERDRRLARASTLDEMEKSAV